MPILPNVAATHTGDTCCAQRSEGGHYFGVCACAWGAMLASWMSVCCSAAACFATGDVTFPTDASTRIVLSSCDICTAWAGLRHRLRTQQNLGDTAGHMFAAVQFNRPSARVRGAGSKKNRKDKRDKRGGAYAIAEVANARLLVGEADLHGLQVGGGHG